MGLYWDDSILGCCLGLYDYRILTRVMGLQQPVRAVLGLQDSILRLAGFLNPEVTLMRYKYHRIIRLELARITLLRE